MRENLNNFCNFNNEKFNLHSEKYAVSLWGTFAFIMIGQIRADKKRSGREIRGRDRERSLSRDSNSGHPYRNSAVCWRAAHKPIGLHLFIVVCVLLLVISYLSTVSLSFPIFFSGLY